MRIRKVFLLQNSQLKKEMFASFEFSLFILLFGAASVAVSEKCAPGTLLDVENRDEDRPTFPLKEDPRLKPSNILKAHEILRIGLQQFLEFRDDDLGFYLNHVLVNKPPFKDEYGQDIRSYYKVFKFIWVQFNETLCQNYATQQYDKDTLDLCSVARFLSHQAAVNDRETIMKRMGDALGYKCHPCTPYKRKEHGGTVVPNTDDIGSIENLSLEQIIILCKDYDHHGHKITASSTVTPTTSSESTSTPKTATTNSPTTTTTATKALKDEIIIETITVNKTTHSSSIDYAPCSNSDGNLYCDKVHIEEVQKVFERTALPRLAYVRLILQPYIFSETFIPEDVFRTKRILDISIGYPLKVFVNSSLRLQVDVDAFRFTKLYTNSFIINTIDCTLLDLGFLSGFEKLTHLTFLNIFNIQHCLPSLPTTLPRLSKLYFGHCSGFNVIDTFPTLTKGLEMVRFFNDDESSKLNSNVVLNDKTVDRIMDWLLLSSANTLEEMVIAYMNQVTRVPQKISLFKSLKIFRLYNNNIPIIKSGELSFSAPVSLLRIYGNEIKEIEPGAFEGNFKDAEIFVYINNLTRFEESVFGAILQQMASGKGFIDANGNPFDCSEENICSFTWLRSYKAGIHFRLNCSNGTLFKDLQPAGFNHCPQPLK